MNRIRFALISIIALSLFLHASPHVALAATSFPKPFPLTARQKSNPLFSPYGVVVAKRDNWMKYESRDKVYRLLSEAGVKWIRLFSPFTRWANIQPQKDVWNWKEFDEEIQMMGNYGLEIQGSIFGPCSPDLTCNSIPPDWLGRNDSNFDWYYKQYVTKLIKRYSISIGGERKIKYWMSFNEWNGAKGVGEDDLTNYVPPQYFVKYMKIISGIMKNYSPDLQLSAPFSGAGLIQEAAGGRHDIRDAFSPPNSAGEKYQDFLAFHKYARYTEMNDRNAPFISAARAMAVIKFNPQYNISAKPVWVTEGGYGCNPSASSLVCTPAGEQLQADDLQKRYWIAFHPASYGIDNRLKIDKVFWFKDISANTGWDTWEWGTSGLFNWENNYEPRPAYFAYKAMALWYTPPEKVLLTSPAKNAQITTNKPFFKWQAPNSFGSERFKRYVIQVDDDQYFTSPIQLETSNPWGFGYTTATEYQSSVDLPNGTYFWRVKVEDTKGNFGSWSSSRTITVTGSPPPGNPADLNSDGKVDESDYNILKNDFGKTNTTPGWIPTDIIKNGKVDIFDYNVLVKNFGR